MKKEFERSYTSAEDAAAATIAAIAEDASAAVDARRKRRGKANAKNS